MFTIDVASRVPIYKQLVSQVEDYIVLGVLKPGEQLPSVRELGESLGINPNTIQRAYAKLEQRGAATAEAGKGNFVTKNVEEVIKNRAEKLVSEIEDKIAQLRKIGVQAEIKIEK